MYISYAQNTCHMSFWNRQPSRPPHCTLSHYKILNWKIFMSFLYFGGTLKQTSFSRAVSKRSVIYWVGSSRDNTLWRLLWMSEPNELSAHLADWPAGCWKGINLVHFTLFSYTLRSVFELEFFSIDTLLLICLGTLEEKCIILIYDIIILEFIK